MTDRELLELAARAVGLNMVDYHAGTARIQLLERDQGNGWVSGGNVPWNPLHDDGDALRLAVKLRLDVCTSVCRVGGEEGWYSSDADEMGVEAATRRAIVRSAAEIGKTV